MPFPVVSRSHMIDVDMLDPESLLAAAPATFGRASGTPPFGISTGQSVNAFCGPACGLVSII